MNTILEIVAHDPKLARLVSIPFLIIGFFINHFPFIQLNPDWLLHALQYVSLGIVMFINWPHFLKRLKEVTKKKKHGRK